MVSTGSKSDTTDTTDTTDITAIRKDGDALRIKIHNDIDPVAQCQLVREQVPSNREADLMSLAAEREAELIKNEADW